MALSSESDCSLSEDPPVVGPVTMVSTQVEPATVYQVVYDLSGLGTVKPESGQENVVSIELGEFDTTNFSFCIVSIFDNWARGGGEEGLEKYCLPLLMCDASWTNVLFIGADVEKQW